ncbi:MAG: gamma carbonic anhydrase family protein [Oscillospiraceae bacterium]|nr:gamma carbonic anhydrase family protein [Oscillospiraceae bacterium]
MDKKYYIASGAVVTGDVELGTDVSIWHNAVLRGDSGKITVGDRTNIQDGCILHEETTIGADCTVGHGAILHGCTIGDGCLIGMGAIVLTGAVLGEGCLVGAGALVTGKTNAPAGSVLLGSPAKIVKELTQEQMLRQKQDAMHYVELAQTTIG